MMIFRLLMLAVACVALIGIRPSDAVQAVSSKNPSNTFAAGVTGSTLSVSSALFGVSGLQPGTSVERCVSLKNVGNVPYSSTDVSATSSGVLAGELDVVLDVGTGATGSSCAGFVENDADVYVGKLDDFPTTGSPLSDPTNIAANAEVSYRITISLPGNVAQSLQGQAANFSFSWESQT